MSFSVKVIDQRGQPVRNVRVYSDFGLWKGGLTDYTDDNGWAYFKSSGNDVSVEIYVNGKSKGSHGISDGGESFSFVI